mgnify:CR=1 FL=1
MTEFRISREYDGKLRRLHRITCAACGRHRWLPKVRLRPKNFCSKLCVAGSRQVRVEVPCGNCRKHTTRTRSKLLNSKSGLYFCSRSCKDTAQSIDGGLAAIQPAHYGSAGGRYNYRNRALRRLPRACARCGYSESSRMLDVHHTDGNRRNGALSNLQVLCVWCHALDTRKVQTHSWAGTLGDAGRAGALPCKQS